MPEARASQAMILFDGECGLCHGFVRFVLARDRAGVFHFAPLRSETGTRLITERGLPSDVSTIVLIADGEARVRGDAVRAILRQIGGVWRIAGAVYGVLPRFARDGLYRLVAKLRFRVFGRVKNACPSMPADMAERLHG